MQGPVRRRRQAVRIWRGAVAALMAISLLWLVLSIIPQYVDWVESVEEGAGEEEGLGVLRLRRGHQRAAAPPRTRTSTAAAAEEEKEGAGKAEETDKETTQPVANDNATMEMEEEEKKKEEEKQGDELQDDEHATGAGRGESDTETEEQAPAREESADDEFRHRGHVFYYPWYDNPEHNKHKEYLHWNHDILANPYQPGSTNGDSYVPPEQIGANFYPQLGCYSSVDRTLMRQHMEMIRKAGLGVLTVSWYPPSFSDGQIRAEPGFSDSTMRALLDAAHEYGLKVNMHIEPYPSRSEKTLANDIRYIIDNYGNHPAFYRYHKTNLPMFYVYDSYHTEYKDWAKILGSPDKYPDSIRGTEYDAMVIALFVEGHDYQKIPQGHFDGVYTYFATDGFTHGSTTANWPRIAKWAKDNGMIFIPSIGPGYDDTRIRPWNQKNARSREQGRYYDRMMGAALNLDPQPDVISITSWNEWHEGTQIEPAIPKVAKAVPGRFEEYGYVDYGPHEPDHYLTMTAQWMTKFTRKWRT